MIKEEIIKELNERERLANLSGGEEKIKKQHNLGKLTARERIGLLLDEGSFVEFDKFVVHRCHEFEMENNKILGDGVITGYGTIDGRLVYIFSQDFTVFGGSLGEAYAKKICKVLNLAIKNGNPIIGLYDTGGARIQEGLSSLGGYGDIFLLNSMASGVIPQISAIMGPCIGASAYSPAMSDFIIMVKDISYMFLTSPEIIKGVTHEETSMEKIGGAITHNQESGVSHFISENEEECIYTIRQLLSFIPQNNMEDPPLIPCNDDINRKDEKLIDIIPENHITPYDMHEIILSIVDDKVFLEVQKDYAKNIIIGFARFNGRSVGIVANQPAVLAGCLDINASVKAARFVRFCDLFNIPIVTLVDSPGCLPSVSQEVMGVIRHGAKLLYAFAEATVPKITIIVRKAYGVIYDIMSSKHLRGDVNLAYPNAEITVMGPDSAVDIIYKNQIKEAGKKGDELKKKLVLEYRSKNANPFKAAELGYIDEIIVPQETRPKIIKHLEMLQNKRDINPPKKYGNIPL